VEGGEFLEIDHDKKRFFKETLSIRYSIKIDDTVACL